MGIKNIHLTLIIASDVLAVLFGLWGISHDYAVLGYISLGLAIVLGIYGLSFVKKMKAL